MAQATLNGQLADDGGYPCDAWFQWGGSTSYGMETGKQGGLTSGDLFNTTITGLAEGAAYHFRAVAQNRLSISYGSDMVFYTLSPVGPVVLIPDILANQLEAAL